MEKVLISEMTWVDVKNKFKTDDIVIIPIGSLEQHGYHSALWFDTAIAEYVSKTVGMRENVLVAPMIPIGNCRSLMGFPGGASIDPSLIHETLCQIAECYIQHGAKKILFLNSHGGNASGVKMACNDLYDKYGVICVQAEWYNIIAQKTQYKRNDHGGEYGTSLVLAIDETKIDMSKAKTVKMKDLTEELVFEDELTYKGVNVYLPYLTDYYTEVGNYGPEAENSTKEKGEEMLNAYLDYCCELINSLRKINIK